MKTTTIGLHVLLVLTITSTLSCKKDTGSPSQIPREMNKVITSDWFYINDWIPEPGTNGQQYFHIKDIPGVSANLLQNGRLQVFGRYEYGTVSALPFIFNQTAFGVEKQPGELKFTITFLGEPRVSAFSVSFKYILIPGTN